MKGIFVLLLMCLLHAALGMYRSQFELCAFFASIELQVNINHVVLKVYPCIYAWGGGAGCIKGKKKLIKACS